MSEKTNETTLTSLRLGWLKSKSFWFLVLWLAGGVILFAEYRNLIYGFPVVIFAWLFLCIAWFGIPRWKWWGIPITLILAILACVPLSIVYAEYESRETDRALKEFVRDTIAGNSSPEFTVYGDDLPTMSADFTADFVIVSSDNFWMEYEQTIRFANGSEYYVVIVQDSPGHWEVRTRRVKPPSQ